MILFAVLNASPAAAQHFADAQRSIEGGRKALDRWQSFPWYDAKNDTVRRIQVEAPQAPPPPRTPTAPSAWDRHSLILWLGWSVLAILLAVVSVALIRAFLERETNAAATASQARHENPEIDRIEALPFKVERPVSSLLAEAERHYRDGNFEQAVIYYYSYLLVELDKAHVVRLARGKTNRQYLREARRASSLPATPARRTGEGEAPRSSVPRSRFVASELLETTMIAFEDVFFGHHVLSRTRFEACWSQLGEFQHYVAGAAQ